MRISDWSSDVCSSDLLNSLDIVEREGGGGGIRKIKAVKIGRDGQFGRIASAVLPNAAQIGVDADYRSILTEARRDLGQVVGALNAQPRQCAAFERGNRDRHLLQVFRTAIGGDRKSTRQNYSHYSASRMPSI